MNRRALTIKLLLVAFIFVLVLSTSVFAATFLKTTTAYSSVETIEVLSTLVDLKGSDIEELEDPLDFEKEDDASQDPIPSCFVGDDEIETESDIMPSDDSDSGVEEISSQYEIEISMKSMTSEMTTINPTAVNEDLLFSYDLSNLLEGQDSFEVFFEVSDENHGSFDGKLLHEVASGSTLTDLPTPLPNAGYEFLYWEDQDGLQYETSDELKDIVIDSDMTFTAYFAEIIENDGDESQIEEEYLVKLVAVGGEFEEGSITEFTVKATSEGAKLSSAEDFKEPVVEPVEGSTFWWWIDKDDKKIDDLGSFVVSEDCSIYAFCDTDENNDGVPDSLEKTDDEDDTLTFTATFKSGGNGSLSGQTQFTIKIANGDSAVISDAEGGFTLPSPVADAGYEFDHWEDAAGTTISDVGNYPVANNIEIYAEFVATGSGGEDGGTDNEDTDPDEENIVVQYVAGDNGSLNGETRFEVAIGEKLADKAPAPTPVPNDGYVFDSWEDELGNVVNVNTDAVSSDMTNIYANFIKEQAEFDDLNKDGIPDDEQNKYTLTFVAGNGGKLEGKTEYIFIGGTKGDNIPLTIENIVDGPLVIPTPVPSVSNYVFSKWNKSIVADKLELTGDLKVTAKFTVSSCRLRFTCNGKVVAEYNSQKGKSINGVTGGKRGVPNIKNNSNKSFVGWLCPDGKVRTTEEVMSMKTSGSMVFRAYYSSSKKITKR